MRGLPSSDHSLVYSMMSTGHVIVALATSESEFYGTFPGPVSVNSFVVEVVLIEIDDS